GWADASSTRPTRRSSRAKSSNLIRLLGRSLMAASPIAFADRARLAPSRHGVQVEPSYFEFVEKKSQIASVALTLLLDGPSTKSGASGTVPPGQRWPRPSTRSTSKVTPVRQPLNADFSTPLSCDITVRGPEQPRSDAQLESDASSGGSPPPPAIGTIG